MWYIESEADGRRYELDRELIIGREGALVNSRVNVIHQAAALSSLVASFSA